MSLSNQSKEDVNQISSKKALDYVEHSRKALSCFSYDQASDHNTKAVEELQYVIDAIKSNIRRKGEEMESRLLCELKLLTTLLLSIRKEGDLTKQLRDVAFHWGEPGTNNTSNESFDNLTSKPHQGFKSEKKNVTEHNENIVREGESRLPAWARKCTRPIGQSQQQPQYQDKNKVSASRCFSITYRGNHIKENISYSSNECDESIGKHHQHNRDNRTFHSPCTRSESLNKMQSRTRSNAPNQQRVRNNRSNSSIKSNNNYKRKSISSQKEKAQTSSSARFNRKLKYSDHARDQGWADLELIESVERDIVEHSVEVSWDTIAELKVPKQLLHEAVVLPLWIPDFFQGIRRPWKGVLMFGPPGTGKTMLAKAVATECQTCFFNVSASTLSSKFRGESEKMLRILFEMALYHAPSTIFFDEIDSLAGSRGGSNEHEASRRVKTELMVQMDGVSSISQRKRQEKSKSEKKNEKVQNETVIVLGATNTPWDLDEALRRRFEKRIYIPLPSNIGREELFRINLHGTEVSTDVNIKHLSDLTEGYSGADISNVVRDAAMMSVRRVMISAQEQGLLGIEIQKYLVKNKEKLSVAVSQDDLLLALNKVGKSVGCSDLQKYDSWMQEFGSS